MVAGQATKTGLKPVRHMQLTTDSFRLIADG
jgi:hypothetical protein